MKYSYIYQIFYKKSLLYTGVAVNLIRRKAAHKKVFKQKLPCSDKNNLKLYEYLRQNSINFDCLNFKVRAVIRYQNEKHRRQLETYYKTIEPPLINLERFYTYCYNNDIKQFIVSEDSRSIIFYIYKIILDGKEYIYCGSSRNLTSRKSEHKSLCFNNSKVEFNYPHYKYIRQKGVTKETWNSRVRFKIFPIVLSNKNEIYKKEKIVKKQSRPMFDNEFSKTHRSNISESRKGSKWSESHRQLMEARFKGSNNPCAGLSFKRCRHKTVTVKSFGFISVCLDTDKEIYYRYLYQMVPFGFQKPNVIKVVNGERKSHKGHTFRRATKEEMEKYLKTNKV